MRQQYGKMKLKENVVLRDVLGQAVLADNSGSMQGVIKLNSTAAFICDMLKSETDKNAIAEKLCEEFDTSKENAIRDVDAVCTELLKHGLLEELTD